MASRPTTEVAANWFFVFLIWTSSVPTLAQSIHSTLVFNGSEGVVYPFGPIVDEVNHRLIHRAGKWVDDRNYYVHTIPRGNYIQTSHHHAYVADSRGVVVKDASGSWYAHYLEVQDYPPFVEHYSSTTIKTVHLDGNVIFFHVGCQYWHFHDETMAQLYIYQRAGVFNAYNQSQLTIALDNGCPTYIGIFKNYGLLIADYKVIVLHPRVRYVANGNLFVTSKTSVAGWIPHAWFITHQNAHIAKVDPHPSGRYYIAREAEFKRAILNRDDLHSVLETRYKFNITFLTNLTIDQQKELYQSAQVILAPEGTGLIANMAYSNPNSTIMIALFQEPLHSTPALIIPAILGFKHYHAISPSYAQDAHTRNYYVNITEVCLHLDRILQNDAMAHG